MATKKQHVVEVGQVYRSRYTSGGVKHENHIKVVGLYKERCLQTCVEVEIVYSTDPEFRVGWRGGWVKDKCTTGRLIK